MNCLNCGNEFESPFCPNCGQKKTIKQYSLQNIVFSELPRVLFNTDKGLLLNLKEMLLRPRSFVQGYLSGKRVKVFKPLQFAVLAITILTIVDNQFSVPIKMEVSETMTNSSGYELGTEFGRFLKSNIRYFWISGIFVFAFLNQWFFKRFNFAEHVIINGFVMGQAAFIAVLFFPIFPYPFLVNPCHLLPLWILSGIILYDKEETPIFTILMTGITFLLGYFFIFFGPAIVMILREMS